MLKCTPSWAAVSPYKYRRKNSSPSGGGSAMICAISSRLSRWLSSATASLASSRSSSGSVSPRRSRAR
uniref:hypothetical protein n=1 Tax=Gemmiger sp. TaxID=2049027 RepID=UPI003FEE95F6